MSRVKFLNNEEESMWNFFMMKLRRREYDAYTMNRSIWSDFTRRDDNCRHTSSSIANHFKRHMITRLEDTTLPKEDIRLILNLCSIKMTSEAQLKKLKLRLQCDVRVDRNGCMRLCDEGERQCDFTMPPNAAPMGTSTPMAHKQPMIVAFTARDSTSRSALYESSNIAVVSPTKRPSDSAHDGTDSEGAKKSRSSLNETNGGGDDSHPVPIHTPMSLTPVALTVLASVGTAEEERRQPVVQQLAVEAPVQLAALQIADKLTQQAGCQLIKESPPSQQPIQPNPVQQSSIQLTDQSTGQISLIQQSLPNLQPIQQPLLNTQLIQQPLPNPQLTPQLPVQSIQQPSTSAVAAIKNQSRPTSAVITLSTPWYDNADDELSFDVEPDVDLNNVELSEENRCDVALHERIRRYPREFSDASQEDRYYRDLLRLRVRLVAQRILPAARLLDDVPSRIAVTLAELAELLKLLCT